MTMRKAILFSVTAAAALISASGDAAAQDALAAPDLAGGSYLAQEVAAPRRALEVTLGTAYMQGFGGLEEGAAVGDTAGAGVSFELGLGQRISPRWALGISGAYQTFDAGEDLIDDAGPDGATARIEATYHLQPYSRLDPWLKLGTGYRHLCECGQPGGGARLNGLELANLSAGLDLRMNEHIGIAPMIGAGLDMFLWDGTEAIDDPRFSTFILAGLQARFDLGGTYERPSMDLASY